MITRLSQQALADSDNFFLVMGTFTIYSLSTSQMCDTVALTVAATSCTLHPQNLLISWLGVCTFSPLHPFSPPASFGSHKCDSCFCEGFFSILHISEIIQYLYFCI